MKHYFEIRDEIETGDLYFTSSPALISRIIRLFTRAEVSHVGMFIKLGERIFTVECIEGKGCIMSFASVRLENVPLVFVHTHTKNKIKLVNDVLNDVNRIEYNWWGAVLSLFFRTKSSKKFCSEWIAEKLNITFPYLSRGITPIDLLNNFIR